MDGQRYLDTTFGSARRTAGPHGYVAYFPTNLPQSLDLAPSVLVPLANAEAALGRLAGVGRMLPFPAQLMRPFLQREALASTRIEGTQASLDEVFDAALSNDDPGPDVEEVLNYARALDFAADRLNSLPLSGRFIREVHHIVLDGVRGRERHPGEFRRSQNWIGSAGSTIANASFVPPPSAEIPDLISDWEQYLHRPPTLPVLVETALLHYQFETIHPFLDGNGRVGRLLIVLHLMHRERLPAPLLYLSPWLERQRDTYYSQLQRVREHGDFESWLLFFLAGVEHQATDAVVRAEKLLDLRERYRSLAIEHSRSQAPMLVDIAFEFPVLSSALVESKLAVTRPTSLRLLSELEAMGILDASPGGPRGQKRWRATEIVDLITDESA